MRCQINEHLTHNCIYCSFQHAYFKLPEICFLSTFTIKLWENKWDSTLLPNFLFYHSFIDIFCELTQERNIFHLNNNNNLPSKSFERKLIKIRYRKREVLSAKSQKLQRTENWKKYKEQIQTKYFSSNLKTRLNHLIFLAILKIYKPPLRNKVPTTLRAGGHLKFGSELTICLNQASCLC